MREVDLSIVTYQPDFELLRQLLESLAEPTAAPLRRNLLVHDNSVESGIAARIEALARGFGFDRVEVHAASANLGFGRGHNANAARAKAPFFFVLNQDCVLEPGVLDGVMETATTSASAVAAWELRQIPYEHPKAYDPVTLQTPWVSGAATLFRRRAFDEVRGFDPRLFMYGEDVDLSWRLRAAGWRLTYQPRFAVVHRTYKQAHDVKPLQVFGGVATNLCLRARYGGLVRTLKGIVMCCAEIVARQSFPGRRWGLVKALGKFLVKWPAFAASRVHPTADFSPVFSGWSYELRREGAFHEFASRRETAGPQPKVSILIRTVDRPAWLREALASCANQTYRNLEVVVVEDGPERSRAVIDEFRDRLEIRYSATGQRTGRAHAGNVALANATGEWLNFLDDDDVLFADHVEVLVDEVLKAGAAGAFGLSWETHTRTVDSAEGRYEEVMHVTRHNHPFDRLTLWHHNFLPIQAVLFHRRLYERHGGFAEDMDQLEDWNLWTRYTLEDDFVRVLKTTSKYRVPAQSHLAADRQVLLDRAYQDALERQAAMKVTLSPRDIARIAESYGRSQSVVMVTRGDLRRLVGRHPLMARVASYRPVAGRFLRRMGWLK